MTSLVLCNINEVESGASKLIELDNLPPLAVFNVEGEYYVINDTCTHGEASLCDGEIEDGEVSCPWHNAKFCIKTGKALTFPAVEAQKAYPTRVENSQVIIEI